jgi:predicted enzyme related to lactoylglutathione lyase
VFDSLDHVIFFVTDMKRATSFYRDRLGLKVKMESPSFTTLALGTQWIALHSSDDSGRDIGNGPLVYLRVSNIDEAVLHLEKGGAKIASKITSIPTGRIATFFDSEGNALGLFQPKR